MAAEFPLEFVAAAGCGERVLDACETLGSVFDFQYKITLYYIYLGPVTFVNDVLCSL